MSRTRTSIFKPDGIEKLSFEYIPSRLPHREDEISYIVKMLNTVLESPGALSQRILITGETGSGKTATARKVGDTLERIAKSKGLALRYAHVNCRTVGGKFGLAQAIVQQAAPKLTARGYGPTEILHSLWDYLNEHNILLILTLDEIDYYVRTTGEDIVYELTRLTDGVTGVPQRINFMFIARDHSFMEVMRPETLSRFRPQERIEFPPYKENQLKDIILDRVAEAFVEDAVSEEVTDFIARNAATYGHGDARYAISLLCAAGMIANREESRFVLPEHVREAQGRTDPRLRDEDIALRPDEEKYILLALARSLKKEREAIFIPLIHLEKIYKTVCEEYKAKPVGRVLLHALLKNLQILGIVNIDEKFRVELPYVKAEVLERFLVDLLQRKRGWHG
jgi:cell division control protein 6